MSITRRLDGTALRPRVVQTHLVVTRDHRQLVGGAVRGEELEVNGVMRSHLHVRHPNRHAETQEVVGHVATTEHCLLGLDVVESQVILSTANGEDYGLGEWCERTVVVVWTETHLADRSLDVKLVVTEAKYQKHYRCTPPHPT